MMSNQLFVHHPQNRHKVALGFLHVDEHDKTLSVATCCLSKEEPDFGTYVLCIMNSGMLTSDIRTIKMFSVFERKNY